MGKEIVPNQAFALADGDEPTPKLAKSKARSARKTTEK